MNELYIENIKKFSDSNNNETERKEIKSDIQKQNERQKFIEEREIRAALRRQNQPLWQYEAEKLPAEQREKFRDIIEKIIENEENTEIEVAMEEARKMEEDVEEIIKDGKAKDRIQACAEVSAQKEYLLKDKTRIEKEESVRPYFLLVTEALKKDDLETAETVIKTLPPEKKQIFSEVQDILDRSFEKKQKQYIQEGKEEKLVELMRTRDMVSSQFDLKKLSQLSSEEKNSPELKEAAKEFLLGKIQSIAEILSGDGLRQYIWTREELKREGVNTDSIDTDAEVRYTLKTIIVKDTEFFDYFISEQIDHFRDLSSQLEISGIMAKNELMKDKRVHEIFSLILQDSLFSRKNLAGKEMFKNYLSLRDKLSKLGILKKKLIDSSEENRINLLKFLINEIPPNKHVENKLGNLLDILEIMGTEGMLSADQMKKLRENKLFLNRIKTSLVSDLKKCSPIDRDKNYVEWRMRIARTGLASEKQVDEWLDEKRNP